ncbi:hypothetical protein SAMN02745664_101108 [Moraxella cuniculi DSM 21768]|uniref:Uncharacterized protein n=1 Tax=Moraxella cuniculi DSM 21768 TaxID=1122245 RepID=A0A1N7D9Z7_9GAMM|nr:hypothetical protein SAMN02745664_101108 [Moraxella cuniculi DSM 21768]
MANPIYASHACTESVTCYLFLLVLLYIICETINKTQKKL